MVPNVQVKGPRNAVPSERSERLEPRVRQGRETRAVFQNSKNCLRFATYIRWVVWVWWLPRKRDTHYSCDSIYVDGKGILSVWVFFVEIYYILVN